MVLELESITFSIGKKKISEFKFLYKVIELGGGSHLFSKISLIPWRTLYGGKKNLVPSELQLHSISSLAFAKSKSS